MCFSAEADLVAGLVVGAIGIDAWRHVRRPADVPLVMLPVVLGLHQLIEAVVWLGLEDRVHRSVVRRRCGPAPALSAHPAPSR